MRIEYKQNIFEKGDLVFHRRFGDGVVIATDKSLVLVLFHNANEDLHDGKLFDFQKVAPHRCYVFVNNTENLKLSEPLVKKEWTATEKALAKELTKHLLLDLFDKNQSVVFYVWEDSVMASLEFGFPSVFKTVVAKPKNGDPHDPDIGKCVALCRLVGRKVPDFIMK